MMCCAAPRSGADALNPHTQRSRLHPAHARAPAADLDDALRCGDDAQQEDLVLRHAL